jgi:hypothetical protein
MGDATFEKDTPCRRQPETLSRHLQRFYAANDHRRGGRGHDVRDLSANKVMVAGWPKTEMSDIVLDANADANPHSLLSSVDLRLRLFRREFAHLICPLPFPPRTTIANISS